jgi:uncharacterized protein (TIGR00288 family)
MNVTTDNRSNRIAVFIDFDNVEIGVKNTIGGQLDIGLVLDAIKERGEIVTKIAYSDWKRAGDYSRLLTQHAIRMVQRNVTPGGDKNGADITMALDALEMAFTHDHINAFVIVGGDSDFISLVEKLKQYGRKVIVVGGRQFTSSTMQQNCHEFIAYENLVGTRTRTSGRGAKPTAATSPVSKVLPLIQRALKVLADREATPQLGLLKSTLLQLDSTFSEREYGAGSFRDFMEKVAESGAVTLREAGRNVLVEAKTDGGTTLVADEPPVAVAPAAVAAAAPVEAETEEETLPPSPMTMQDGIRAVQTAFGGPTPPRWPMYVRQAKQFLRNAIDGFDERNYGFATVVDLLRAAGKEGVLRIERDRQGAVRVFAGPKLAAAPPQPVAVEVEPAVEPEPAVVNAEPVAEVVAEAPIVEAVVVETPAKATRRRKGVKPRPGPNTPKPKRAAKARKTVRRKDVAADRSE